MLGDARLFREARSEEQEVDDRVVISLLQARANRGVFARDPVGPARFDRGRRQSLQRRRPQLRLDCLEDRPGVSERNVGGARLGRQKPAQPKRDDEKRTPNHQPPNPAPNYQPLTTNY